MHRTWRGVAVIAMTVLIAGVSGAAARRGAEPPTVPEARVRPGITVLLQDSMQLIAGKRRMLVGFGVGYSWAAAMLKL